MKSAKPFDVSKELVWQAYKLIKSNGGGAGVDDQSIVDFDGDLNNNLYRIWNRMASGSYFPPPVKAVEIPKQSGGMRILGIPTVSDRIAQMVVKLKLEPAVEPYFHEDSYGYRPKKSAHQALDVTRRRCWRYDFVLEFDIRGLFDNIDHALLMMAVRKHTDCKWTILYIQRWLIAPMQMQNKEVIKRDRGTPQGGVISPLLANLFLHYAFDKWMRKECPEVPFCRYADDGIIHCMSLEQAQTMREHIEERLKKCGLELHPDKTKIIYCKDSNRRGGYEHIQFDFLGFTFRPRRAKNRFGKIFDNFSLAMSNKAVKAIKQKVRSWKLQFQNDKSIEDLAHQNRAKIFGWINYYSKFHSSTFSNVANHIDSALNKWAMRKFKKLKGHPQRARHWLRRNIEKRPELFPHWRYSLKQRAR